MLKSVVAAMALSAALVARQALADDIPQYKGPMFANPNPPPTPEPYWQVGLNDHTFQPIDGQWGTCMPTSALHPTAERFQNNMPPVIAHFRYGVDEVVIYDFKSDGNDEAMAYTTSKETCEGIHSGKIPLVKPQESR